MTRHSLLFRMVGLVLLLHLWPQAGLAGKRGQTPEAAFSKTEHVLKFINQYRDRPEPQRLPTIVRAMSRLGMLIGQEKTGVYVGFIAGILGDNPKSAEKLIAQSFPLPPEDQVVLIKAIAFSGLENWKQVLGTFTERMPARGVLIRKYLYGDGKTLSELALDDGAFVLDAHWGYYFATGKRRPVSRIVSALAWSTDQNDLDRLTIGSMAKWTLASNSSRDKALRDILKAEMNNQPADVRAPLREVIIAAETFELEPVRKDAFAAIEKLKATGPQKQKDYGWWGKAGQTALALGCVTASALGQAQVGIPCVIGGALSSAGLALFGPGQNN
jgi:hypothetical protein